MSSSLIFAAEVISPEAERRFLDHCSAPSFGCPHAQWTQLKRRRLILCGACPAQPGGVSSEATTRSPIPSLMLDGELLESVNKRLPDGVAPFCPVRCECFSENSNSNQQPAQEPQPQQVLSSSQTTNILINSYTSPNGIALHTDGPAYEELVCLLSFGSTLPLVFTPIDLEHMEKVRQMLYDSAQKQQMRRQQQQQLQKKPAEASIYDGDDDDDAGDAKDGDENAASTTVMSDDVAISWIARAELFRKLESLSDLLTPEQIARDPEKIQTNLQDLRLSHPASFAVVLPPRSLVIFTGSIYSSFMHGITDCAIDVLPRSKIAKEQQQQQQNYFTESNLVDQEINIEKCSALELNFVRRLVQLKQMPPNEAAAEVSESGWAGPRRFLITMPSTQGQLFVNVREQLRVSLTYRRVKV